MTLLAQIIAMEVTMFLELLVWRVIHFTSSCGGNPVP